MNGDIATVMVGFFIIAQTVFNIMVYIFLYYQTKINKNNREINKNNGEIQRLLGERIDLIIEHIKT